MTLYHVYDAAFPPPAPYPGTQVAALYLGGNTPHAATTAQWNAQAGRRYCPIWTGFGEDHPADHARQAAAAAGALGWAPAADPWRLIALDFESEVNAAWITAFAESLTDEGFVTVTYESLSAVAGGDPTCHAWWVPDWNGVPDLPPLPNVGGHQYTANVPWMGTAVDLSVFDQDLYDRCGRGLRH